ncbi:MAG: efflux RND transporter permease subunit [Lysobacterales bacterium]
MTLPTNDAGRVSLFTRLLTNHPLVNILFTVVVLMGVLSYIQMPREQDPDVNFNWININTSFPGASAEDVESLVTGPLEDALRTVQNIRWVSSSSREGTSNILVRFRDLSDRLFDKRVSDVRREVQNAVNSDLPPDIIDPNVLELTTSNGFPTALVGVLGQADDEALRLEAYQVKSDLERMPGVDKVTAFGLHEPEIHVSFDPALLAANGLRATQFADYFSLAFRDVNAGSFAIGSSRYIARVPGATADLEELAAYQIASPISGIAPTAAGDLARIERGRSEPRQLVSINGKPAVVFSVAKAGGANTLELVDQINLYIDQRNQLRAGSATEILLADDQTIPTRNAVSTMQTNALLGLILVLGVCWVFLGLRIAALVSLGLVFAICGTLWVVAITGNTVNQSVLLGIVIVLGMLVDDAVVVVEAIYYRMQRGMAALDAAVAGLKEVMAPVTAAVATTMAAFLPLMLLPGVIGKFMFVIPFVVTVGLLISLLEAFWVLPAHMIDFAGSPKRQGRRQDRRKRWTQKLRLIYARALCRVMRKPAPWLGGMALGMALAAGAVGVGAVRMDFFTFDPIRLFYVNVDMPAGTTVQESLRQTRRLAERTEQLLAAEQVRAISGLAGIKFTETEIVYGDQFGQLQVSLTPATSAHPEQPAEVIESLRPELEKLAGDASISYLEISGGPPSGLPINVKVRSDDFNELRNATDAVLEIVRNIKGSKDVRDNDVPGSPEVTLNVDHGAAGRIGLASGEVARLARLHVDGEVVAFARDRGEKVELRVRAEPKPITDVTDLLQDPISGPGGQVTTLGGLLQPTVRGTRSTIFHFNLRRAITVTAELDDDINNTQKANAELVEQWNDIAKQYPNTDLEFSGELDDLNESLEAMGGLFLLGLGLIYLIIATQFRSYFQPLLIIVTVPMAFTGVVLGLIVTNNPLSIYTLYGVVALTGIAVNGAIVLIDAANSRLRAGMRPLHATVYAAKRRVIPIIMTTTTTIAGLFSLAVGLGGKSLLWGPVASSIVAGLAFASLLTLFVIPTLYRLFMRGHGQPDPR